jgi:hypothetical protein
MYHEIRHATWLHEFTDNDDILKLISNRGHFKERATKYYMDIYTTRVETYSKSLGLLKENRDKVMSKLTLSLSQMNLSFQKINDFLLNNPQIIPKE